LAKVGIDFDGVLSTYASGYTTDGPLDPPVPGAQEFVQWLMDRGYEVFIFTSRCDIQAHGTTVAVREMHRIRDWLHLHKFPEIEDITATKKAADFYIDDRGFRFEGDFNHTMAFMTMIGIAPWHKKEDKNCRLTYTAAGTDTSSRSSSQ
jgi:hypothetical protein